MSEDLIDAEFDRQRDVLVRRNYPSLVGQGTSELLALVERLRDPLHVALGARWQTPSSSWVPFVVVVGAELVSADALVPTTTLAGSDRPGVVDRNHGEAGLAPYRHTAEISLPTSPVYLLVDVERGEEFCGVRPEDALPVILGRGRTPLTIHEGLALVTMFPSVLEKNKCFMLSGSRRGDRRVPALWISAKAPKLGWCWDGNPHSWLGTVSTATRTGAFARAN